MIGNLGTPQRDDIQQPKDPSPKKEQLALEKTLQGIRSGQSIIQSDLNSINHKLGQKGALHGILEDIADILENSGLNKIVDESKKTRKLLGQAFFGKKARAKELTPEAKLEETTAATKATKIDEEHTTLLSQINENVIKSITENSMFKWFKENWGKLLLAGGILTLPYKYWDKLGKAWDWFTLQDWKTQLGIIAGGFLGYQTVITTLGALPGIFGTLKDMLVTGLVLKWAGILPDTAGLGAKVVTGAGILAIALTIGKMIYDGWMGYHQNWDASSFSKTLGGALGGTGEGSVMGSIGRGVAGAWLGFKLGALFGPVGAIVGLVVGGAIGAIAGFFGGEKVAIWLDGVGKGIADAWNDMGDWFTKKKANYDTWAKDFGQRMAKGTDEWIEAVFSNIWGFVTAVYNAMKNPIETIKKGYKAITAPFRNGMPKVTQGPAAGGEKKKSDAEYLKSLKDKAGPQGADGAIRLEKTAPAPKIHLGGAETPSWLPTGQITLDDQRKNMSGWSGLSGQAKLNSQRMANMFGGLRITSGQRSKERQAEAMMGMKSVDVYSSKWKGKLTKAERTSAPGTAERSMAVAKIMDAGYESKHKHGNAIDFSYPKGYSKKNFGSLKALLEDTFPGSKLLNEKDHLHLAFKPGVAPDQISAGMNQLHEERGGFAGAASNFNVTHANKTVINSQPSSTVIAGDSIRKDSPDKN